MTSANTLFQEINIPSLLNPESIGDLKKQLSEKSTNTRFLILKGNGSVFCDGLDLRWVANNDPNGFKKEINDYGEFLKQLQIGNCITIAVVEGSVSGGGMGIVCSCDYVIATTQSTFSLPEGLLGLIPGMILPSLLNRLSPQVIKKMVFSGQKYSSAVAREFGIADEVINDQEAETALTKAMNTMRSCKKESVADLKALLSNAHLNKHELGQMGINILLTKLTNPEMREKLKDISDFWGE
jgi:enoyl-CoA hydratase/carnithine racemase